MSKPSRAPTSTQPGKAASTSNSKTSTPLPSQPTQLTARSLPSSNAPFLKHPSSRSRPSLRNGPSPRGDGAIFPSAMPSHAGHDRSRVRTSTSTKHQDPSYGRLNAPNNVPTNEPLVENPSARAFLDSFRSGGRGYDARQAPTSRVFDREFGRLDRPREEDEEEEDVGTTTSNPTPAPAEEDASHLSEGAKQRQVDGTSDSPLAVPAASHIIAPAISAPADTFPSPDLYSTHSLRITLHPEPAPDAPLPASMFVTAHLSLVMSFNHPGPASSDEKSAQEMKDVVWTKVKGELREMVGKVLEKDYEGAMGC